MSFWIAIYITTAFGFAFGYIACALFTHSRDGERRDEHEEFPGC